MSTEPDTSESWEALPLRAEATERIDRYELHNRPDEAVLKASLHAFLQWLPEKGRATVARDIKHAIIWNHSNLGLLLDLCQSYCTSKSP
jgi:hypothetical protein